MKPLAFLLTLLLLLPHAGLASTTLTDRYGEVLRSRLPGEDVLSQPVTLDQVSPWMIVAVLAAEDKRFFAHPGVDFAALARAVWQNTRNGRVVSGGSTLTQQLVRLLQPHAKTWRGKIRESLEALWLERRLTKQQILLAYLNEVSLSNRIKGVEAAAQGYFGIPAKDLSLAQAALLAGIPKSPAHYDPVRHWENAVGRQKTVLDRMKTWGWLTPEAHALALAERITARLPKTPWVAPHFTEYVRRHMKSSSGSAGSRQTTLDAELQRAIQGLAQTHLARLQRSHVTNASVIALDNRTGEVLAWVGSANFGNEENHGQVDGVTALRQPGSALKPFLYGLAFSGGMTPSDLLQDEPINLNGYMPKNYDETYHGSVRAREALACSFNVPAVLVGARVGPPAFLQTLHQFGFQSLDQPAARYGYGLALGNGEVTLLELTQAYAALARGGVWMPSRIFMDEKKSAPARRVLDRESSYLITDILSDNAARARAFGLNSAFHLPFPFAAKTGTTKDYRDNWAIGYTPDWTVGVWVGNFDGKPMRRVSGITGAAPLLRDAAMAMEKRYGARTFDRPNGIRDIEICPVSGQLPGLECPDTMREMYAFPFLPKSTCGVHAPARAPGQSSLASVQIKFPATGDLFKIDPRAPRESQAILFRAILPVPGARVKWLIDRRVMPSRGPEAWWRLEPGQHVLRFVTEVHGRSVSSLPVSFLVVP